MQTYLDKINNQNIKQIKKYIKLFQKNINPNISFKEFTMMYQGTLSIASLLKYLAKKGYVESIEQILCEYNLISNYDSLKLTVESLKATGAKVILAHPWRYESIYGFSKKQIENIILNLPFDGIEVYYSQNDSNQTKHWVKFAKENNLELTIGSDFHRVAEADRPNKIEIGYGINNNLNFHNQDIINFLLEKEEIK